MHGVDIFRPETQKKNMQFGPNFFFIEKLNDVSLTPCCTPQAVLQIKKCLKISKPTNTVRVLVSKFHVHQIKSADHKLSNIVILEYRKCRTV